MFSFLRYPLPAQAESGIFVTRASAIRYGEKPLGNSLRLLSFSFSERALIIVSSFTDRRVERMMKDSSRPTLQVHRQSGGVFLSAVRRAQERIPAKRPARESERRPHLAVEVSLFFSLICRCICDVERRALTIRCLLSLGRGRSGEWFTSP